MKKLLIFISCIFCFTTAFAEVTFANVTVLSVRIDSNGHGIVTFSPAASGTPASCVWQSYFQRKTANENAAAAFAPTYAPVLP